MKREKHCRCDSGDPYTACCRPFHVGAEPPDPVRLMRSRFCAYAIGDVDYVWRTLDPAHADRGQPEPEALAQLRDFSRSVRFMHLRVLDHQTHGDEATVLFHAELYEKGKERSFLERSRFRRHPEGWRYLEGDVAPLAAADPRLPGLTLSTAPEVLDVGLTVAREPGETGSLMDEV